MSSETEFPEPPEGWFRFGYHTKYEKVPPLEFATEVDEEGFPLWERPMPEQPEEEKVGVLS